MKRLTILFVFAGLALAQQTIVQQLFSNVNTVTNSAVVNNVGQAGHQVYLQTSGTCTGTSLPVGALQYSFDGTTWNSFGTPSSDTALLTLYTGAGAYNYVRFGVGFAGGNLCFVSAWYVGTPAPLSVNLGAPSATPATAQNLAAVGAAAGTYAPNLTLTADGLGDTGGIPTPILACDNWTEGTVTAASTVNILSPNGGGISATKRVHICGYVASLSAAGTVQLTLQTHNCGGVVVPISPVLQFNAAGTFAYGSGLGRVFAFFSNALSSGYSICATTTGSGATADVFIDYAVF